MYMTSEKVHRRKDKRQRFADEGEKEIQVGYSRGDDVVHVSSVSFFL